MATAEGSEWTADDDVAVENFIQNDVSLRDMAARLERDVTITSDTELEIAHGERVPEDTDSSSSGSAIEPPEVTNNNSNDGAHVTPLLRREERHAARQNRASWNETSVAEVPSGQGPRSHESVKGREVPTRQRPRSHESVNGRQVQDKSGDSSDTDSLKSRHGCSPHLRKNPLKMLKKLTKFDKTNQKPHFSSQFSVVSAGTLPQMFLVKYLGQKSVAGISGLHHVRVPVDQMVAQMRTRVQAKEELNLPLVAAIVSSRGLDLREHQGNKVKDTVPRGIIPLELISYGVQDIKYWKVFTCIVVKTMSRESRSATCHAFLCDSAFSARRMALSLGEAFKLYAKRSTASRETNTNFKLDLRPPDELAEGMLECDV